MTTQNKYNIGDRVLYTNDNGVKIGEKTIVGIDSVSYSETGYGYYINPTATPWFAVKEENITSINA